MCTFSHDLTLEFVYESPARARLVAESVAREVGEIDDDRSRTTIDRRGESVLIDVEARDLVALRAALNTWCALLAVAEDVADVADVADGANVGHRYADGS